MKDILYEKQLSFQEGHSTEHAIIQPIDQVNSSFEKNDFTFGISNDLSKTLDTVDHQILISKLQNYRVNGSCLLWYESYLKNHKQILAYDNNRTSFPDIICGVPQSSILGPLLFFIYVNDLKNALNILVPIMFAEDASLVYSHHNIKILFTTVNEELNRIALVQS